MQSRRLEPPPACLFKRASLKPPGKVVCPGFHTGSLSRALLSSLAKTWLVSALKVLHPRKAFSPQQTGIFGDLAITGLWFLDSLGQRDGFQHWLGGSLAVFVAAGVLLARRSLLLTTLKNSVFPRLLPSPPLDHHPLRTGQKSAETTCVSWRLFSVVR